MSYDRLDSHPELLHVRPERGPVAVPERLFDPTPMLSGMASRTSTLLGFAGETRMVLPDHSKTAISRYGRSARGRLPSAQAATPPPIESRGGAGRARRSIWLTTPAQVPNFARRRLASSTNRIVLIGTCNIHGSRGVFVGSRVIYKCCRDQSPREASVSRVPGALRVRRPSVIEVPSERGNDGKTASSADSPSRLPVAGRSNCVLEPDAVDTNGTGI